MEALKEQLEKQREVLSKRPKKYMKRKELEGPVVKSTKEDPIVPSAEESSEPLAKREKRLPSPVLEPIELKIPQILPQKPKYDPNMKKSQFESTEAYVLHFLKRILHEWETNLVHRSDTEKRSVEGQKETQRRKQCYEHIRPLFRLLKAKNVPLDFLTGMEQIVDFALQREYIKANDAYIRLSIGEAAWPMGVSMTGIHARSGRERIQSERISHVLNNETQRKFIQSIKRILTYTQFSYPNPIRHKNLS